MSAPGAVGATFLELHAAGPVTVAERLGFTVLRGNTISPCPDCRAEFRSSRGHDKRGPVGLTRDGLGWRCHRCGAGGDAVTFAAIVATNTARPGDWRPFFELIERAGLDEVKPAPVAIIGPADPKRPPRAEVLETWTRCRPVVDDAGCAAWLESRGLNPWHVADRDLARALPVDLATPRWAWLRGNSWSSGGYRCVLPLHDAGGTILSLHARNLDPDAGPKGAMPAGYAVAGLVLADGAGGDLLEHGETDGPLWIVEGVPDFLVTATAWGDAADPPPAVLGVISGSWTSALAARVPDGARVVVAVHHDPAGAICVGRIVATLGGRVALDRWSPPEARAAS